MTVVQNTFAVPAGAIDAFLDGQRKNAAIQLRHGARRQLLRRLTGDHAVAGEQPALVFTVSLAFDDWEAFAKFQAGIDADPEWAARMAEVRAQAGHSGVRLLSTHYATEVPL